MKKIFLFAPLVLVGCSVLPTSSEYAFRGESFIKDGKIEKAIASFDKAAKINPDNIEVYAQRGVARYIAGDLDGAVEDFAAVIEKDPFRAEAYSALAAALAAKQDYTAALKHINASIYLNPNNVEAFFTRGTINYSLGDFEQAAADYTLVISMRPFADAYHARALVYEKMGEAKKQESDLQEAAKPDMPQHINSLYGNK